MAEDNVEDAPLWDVALRVLWNVEPPAEPIVIRKGIVIRAPRPQEIAFHQEQRQFYGESEHPWAQVESPGWGSALLELDWRSQPELPDEMHSLQDVWWHAGALLRALDITLRLVGDEWFAPHETILVWDDALQTTAFSNVPRLMLLPKWRDKDRPYVLTPERGRLIRESFRQVWRATTDPLLRVSMNRLEDTYDRVSAEDALIDAWIGLESIYVPGGQREDLGPTIANGLAFFLGQSPSERKMLNERVRKSYTDRSTAIHGHRRSGDAKSEEGYQAFLQRIPSEAALATTWLRQTLLKASLQYPPFQAGDLADHEGS